MEIMMRLLIVSLAVSVFAQPALAREHSRHHHHHHWASAAHSHHWASSRHRLGGYARRARVLAYAGGLDDRQSEMYVVPGAYVVRPQFEPQSPRDFTRSTQTVVRSREGSHGGLDALISRHAQMNGVPEALVHRVVIRESRYNARAIGRGGAMGLMQIKYSTARAMGYTGSPAGLLDPDTNLTYAVRYLAGAYRAAGGNASRAVAYYASGYHGRGVRQPTPSQLAWARAPAPRQVAWAQPSWEMQSSPVLMRGDMMYEPRVRARSRRI
jgi:soluble lytic murein transglycosylase-like protein